MIRNFLQSKAFSVMVHTLLWLALLLVPVIFDESPMARNFWLMRFGVLIVLLSGLFYLTSFWLIPRMLLPGKIIPFIWSVAACIILVCLLNLLNAYVFQVVVKGKHFHFHQGMLFGPVLFSIATVTISISYKLTLEWFRNEKIKKEMENEKLASELAFLKSQVNPHFLFNILNNICSLARKKSDDTESAIIKLSGIMRYMLDESKEERVSLEKEIDYLRNYIELQKMRLSNMANIRFSIEGNPEACTIEPLLLIPFVENAFKHGISYLEENTIDISLKASPDQLILRVENPVVKKDPGPEPGESGVGLKNVRRRLELQYPGRHEIRTEEAVSRYIVHLTIRFR